MNDSSIKILGIDPGFDRLGVCIIEKSKNKEVLLYSTCIVTNKKDDFAKRLSHIAQELLVILDTYHPHELAIETIFFTTNQKTAIAVAEVRGVCLYLSYNQGLVISEYSPPQIKLAIAGHGQANKKDIAHMVPKILGHTLNTKLLDDEIDAIAIALTHSAHRKMGSLR